MTNNNTQFYASLNAFRCSVVLDALAHYRKDLEAMGDIADSVKAMQCMQVRSMIIEQATNWVFEQDKEAQK